MQAVQPLTQETFVPHSGAPLLNAMGRGINELTQSLGAIREADRPASVVVFVITDGQENSSREFQHDVVAAMIAEKQELAGWQFVFLSADLNAVNDAIHQYGVRPTHAMAFDKNEQGSRLRLRSACSRRARRSAPPAVGAG